MSEIQIFFDPIDSNFHFEDERWESTQIGSMIDSHIGSYFPNLKNAKIAIFSVLEYEGSENISSNNCLIRSFFYDLHFEDFPNVVDLGFLKISNERKDSFESIQNICSLLLKKNIMPIVIGGGHDISYAIYKAYVSLDKFITLTTIDNKFDLGKKDDHLSSSSHLSKIITHKPNSLFHYVNIGYQSYFVSPLAVKMLDQMNFDVIRLGDINSSIYELEPIMRNTDFLSLDISAIKGSSASANLYASVNGLDPLDVCQLMRYAGLSDKITSVGIFEYNRDIDKNKQTADLLSQMIWYFIEGYKMRKNELNPHLDNCIKYTVAFEDEKNEIVFYKSKTSARWWMGVPFFDKKNKKRNNYYVACSYVDYDLAMKGEIPKRWIKTYNKFQE